MTVEREALQADSSGWDIYPPGLGTLRARLSRTYPNWPRAGAAFGGWSRCCIPTGGGVFIRPFHTSAPC